MKVRELNVSISQKVNTGNYSSKGYGLSATAELSDFDDVLYVKQVLTNKLSKMFDFEIKKIESGSQ